MPVCTVMLTYEIYEGSLGKVPLPLLSWNVHISGLRGRQRAGIQKFYPELKETFHNSMSFTHNSHVILPEVMTFLTNYLNWLDGEGFKITGHSVDSSTYHGGVTKTHVYTLQMEGTSVP